MKDENALQTVPEDGGSPLSPETLGAVIREIIKPVMQSMAEMLKNNTAALEQLSAAQSIQNDRLEALERQIRLQTPVSGKQASYINQSLRKKARELLDKKEISESKAINRLSGEIRKSLLTRYGAASVKEIPRHEYNVALSMIEMWNDALTVRDIVKEARARESAQTKEDTKLNAD